MIERSHHVSQGMRCRAADGFALVELLVALVAGLVLMIGVTEIATFSRNTYRNQDAQARLQEGARLGLDSMTRDLRLAGHQGCQSLQKVAPNLLAKPPILALGPQTAISGHQGQIGPNWSPVLPVALANMSGRRTDVGVRQGTDVVTVQFGESCKGGLVSAMTQKTDAVVISLENTCELDDPDPVVIIADCSRAEVFRVTGVARDTGAKTMTLSHAGTTNTLANFNKVYATDAEIFRLRSRTYFVGVADATGATDVEPSLWRLDNTRAVNPAPVNTGDPPENPERLVDGVENMLLSFGADADDDRTPDQYQRASGITDWAKVQSVRVNLLFRTENGADPRGESRVVTTPQTYVFDGNTVTARDLRLRREAVATVGLRNRYQ